MTLSSASFAARPPVARSRRPTIGSWLFAGVLGASVAAVLTCTLVIERFVRAEARVEATQFLQIHADALRDALDRGMAQHVETVRAIGQLDQVAAGADASAIRRALDQMHASFPQFAFLGLADRDGRVVAATDGLLEGASVAQRPWFDGARHGLYVGDVHAAVLLAKLLPAQAEPWRFVDIATPVYAPDGRLRGILGAHLSWAWAAQVKRDLVDRSLQRHQAEALVVSADGTVLLGAPALQGRKLGADAPGQLTVHAPTQGFGRVPGLGWDVVLRQPDEVALAAFDALRTRIHAAALALCLLLAPLLWLLARRLATPLNELAARLDGAPAGRGNPLYREAELLGQALDRHARRQAEDAAHLRDLNAELEARVDERTAALARTNDDLARAVRERWESEEHMRAVLTHAPDAYIAVDEAGAVSEWNRQAEQTFGWTRAQALGRDIGELLVPAPQRGGRRGMDALTLGATEARLETAVLHQRGEVIPVQVSVASLRTGSGRMSYAFLHDISERKQAQAQLARLARTDTLTGLPNRHAFDERLAAALARSRRRGQPIALLFLDVDKFKAINDSRGHGAGDAVLKEFGRRVAGAVRETDTVARLAGDEFVVVVEGLHSAAEPETIACKILAAIGRPFDIEGAPLTVSTSIGIAFQPDGHAQPAELLARADAALYAAKTAGRNTFRVDAA